jgi:hypothetical protein
VDEFQTPNPSQTPETRTLNKGHEGLLLMVPQTQPQHFDVFMIVVKAGIKTIVINPLSYSVGKT